MTAIDKKPTEPTATAGATTAEVTEDQMPTVIEAMLFSARRWHDAKSNCGPVEAAAADTSLREKPLREQPPTKPATLSCGATADAAGHDLKFG